MLITDTLSDDAQELLGRMVRGETSAVIRSSSALLPGGHVRYELEQKGLAQWNKDECPVTFTATNWGIQLSFLLPKRQAKAESTEKPLPDKLQKELDGMVRFGALMTQKLFEQDGFTYDDVCLLTGRGLIEPVDPARAGELVYRATDKARQAYYASRPKPTNEPNDRRKESSTLDTADLAQAVYCIRHDLQNIHYRVARTEILLTEVMRTAFLPVIVEHVQALADQAFRERYPGAGEDLAPPLDPDQPIQTPRVDVFEAYQEKTRPC